MQLTALLILFRRVNSKLRELNACDLKIFNFNKTRTIFNHEVSNCMHMLHKTLLIVLFLHFCCACTSNHSTPERNFYFEIQSHDDASKQLAEYITQRISRHKYTITNQSGLEWPFYKELQEDEDIPKDSLMPPHWFLHKMIPKKTNQQLKIDEYFVRIDLSPRLDTLPNYSVEIFRMDSTGLVLSGRTGVHYIDSSEFTTRETLNELYLKSIIRYSFK